MLASPVLNENQDRLSQPAHDYIEPILGLGGLFLLSYKVCALLLISTTSTAYMSTINEITYLFYWRLKGKI